jgi:lysophospholipase L1-like esterase
MFRPFARSFVSGLVALTVVFLATMPAGATERDKRHDYLAVGDSVAFGTNPLFDPRDASNFIGYPDIVAQGLEERLTNASCPGEASGGLISLTGTDNVCRPYRANFPLHVQYSTSQLDFAVGFLQVHKRTRLVTIDIGANDLFVCLRTPPCDFPAMLATLSSNLDTIYGRIRNEGKYRHNLVALTYYALNYADPTGVATISAINDVVAQRTRATRGTVASGFDAFQAASVDFGGDSCAAGLLIALPPPPIGPGGCDIHPSTRGRELLAAAITAVLDNE